MSKPTGSGGGGGYSNLVVGSNVDISQVDQRLLAGVNSVLHLLGKTGTVISGYRSPAHSVAVGGFANDPHTQGRALDVYVNGTPLGQVPGAVAALTALGLVSGNQPNFFHGQPDPAHVQLGGTAASTPASGGGAGTPSSTSATAAGVGCLPAALGMFSVGVAFLVGLCYHFT